MDKKFVIILFAPLLLSNLYLYYAVSGVHTKNTIFGSNSKDDNDINVEKVSRMKITDSRYDALSEDLEKLKLDVISNQVALQKTGDSNDPGTIQANTDIEKLNEKVTELQNTLANLLESSLPSLIESSITNQVNAALQGQDSRIANEIVASHQKSAVSLTPPTKEETEAFENVKYTVIEDMKSGKIKNVEMMFGVIDSSALHSEHINKLLDEIVKMAEESDVDVATLFGQ